MSGPTQAQEVPIEASVIPPVVPVEITGWDAAGPPPTTCPRCHTSGLLRWERLDDIGPYALAARCLCGHLSYHQAVVRVVRRSPDEERAIARNRRLIPIERCDLCGTDRARIHGLCARCASRELKRGTKDAAYTPWYQLPAADRTETERAARLILGTRNHRHPEPRG